MAAGDLLIFKRQNEVYGSKSFGKAATVLFYTVVAVILLWGDKLGRTAVDVLCVATAVMAVIALVLYSFSYLKNKKQELPETNTEGSIQN